jgi:uncharacterized protein YbjT (DUF2867 family)
VNVLVLGAGGFVGRHLLPALKAAGHRPWPGRPDWLQAHRPQAWASLAAGMDAAIYLPGTLHDRAGRQSGWMTRLHHHAPLALLQAGVPRLLHLSALCGGDSAYARSKRAGEQALLNGAAHSVQTLHIVRPSLVVGAGGSSSRQLQRLSAWPWLLLPRALLHCRVQPLRVEDLAEALTRLLRAPASATPLSAVGPESDNLTGWLQRRRALAGRPPARIAAMPDLLAQGTARLGNRVPLGNWNEQTLSLLHHDSFEPDPARSAWLPRLLGREARNPLEGAW